MTKFVRIVRSMQYNPYVNLAMEESLYRYNQKNPALKTLYLWQNDPSIIIGRNQSAHNECKLHEMKKREVTLVRRKSGGGAVYHDRGNAIFSIMGNSTKTENNAIILNALSNIGIKSATASGRNDIIIHDRKISGSAFRFENEILLHHGTMLLNVNMNALSELLVPNPLKLASHGIKSVSARVMNLIDIYPEITRDLWDKSLADAFNSHYGTNAPIEIIDHEKILATDSIVQERIKESSSYDWVYGKEPKFNVRFEHKFSWGYIDIELLVTGNIIEDCSIYTDSLVVTVPTTVREFLTGKPYDILTFNSVRSLGENTSEVIEIYDDIADLMH